MCISTHLIYKRQALLEIWEQNKWRIDQGLKPFTQEEGDQKLYILTWVYEGIDLVQREMLGIYNDCNKHR